MRTESTPQDRRNVKLSQIGLSPDQFGLSTDELAYWNENGYLVRLNVFSAEENDALRQVAEDVVDGKRPFPSTNVNKNALVRDGKIEEQGIYAMHKIHHPSCYTPEFLARVRDPRLTDPLVDILGPDILGINNLFIWKAPKIGLGFPWHQDKFYFRNRFKIETTVGTWTAIDAADRENGCLYVIPGSHKWDIFQHDDLEGSQQQEFKLARGVHDEDGVAVEVPPGAVIWFHSHLCTRVWTTIAYASAVVMLSTTSVPMQNGHILLHRMVGEDNPSCGFAAKPSQTKSTKSNAIFYRFPSLINTVLEGVIDKIQNPRRNDS